MRILCLVLVLTAGVCLFSHDFTNDVDLLLASGRINSSQAEQLKCLLLEEPVQPEEEKKYIDEFAGCEHLYDWGLKQRLHDITGKSYHCIGYSEARQIVYTVIDNHNSIVRGVYTARQKHVTDSAPDPNDMNIEHVWPQSLGATGIARSDMHHLLPCDNKANNARANYPFGYVPDSEITWSVGGSRRGNCIFEPRDDSKGDIARAVFYFSIRYNRDIDDSEEAVLKVWHEQDPPDSREILRTERIFSYQNNRNPFIIHPELVGNISDF